MKHRSYFPWIYPSTCQIVLFPVFRLLCPQDWDFLNEDSWFLRKLYNEIPHLQILSHSRTQTYTRQVLVNLSKSSNYWLPSWLLNKLIYLKLSAISSATVTSLVSLQFLFQRFSVFVSLTRLLSNSISSLGKLESFLIFSVTAVVPRSKCHLLRY